MAMTFKVDPGSLARYGELSMQAVDDTNASIGHPTRFGHAEDAGSEAYQDFRSAAGR
jgi:hypothetical protein